MGMTRDVRDAVAHCQSAVANCQAELRELRAEMARRDELSGAHHDSLLLAVRMVRDHDASARRSLSQLRATADYQLAFDEDEPLVSVIIATYLEWPLLRDRALPSILEQTYERWEVIVVGDGAPDETRQVVESFHDDRIRFVNLPFNTPKPKDPNSAWLISGATPWNTGVSLSQGRWIGSTGDDDALRPSYIESLLKGARQTEAEVSYGLIHSCEPDSDGKILGTYPPEMGQWGLQAALLHGGLRFLALEPSDWVFGIPSDWSLAERMLRIGVRFTMIEEPVVDVYPHDVWGERENRRLSQNR
jgi:glycosyltransferase involved in cell wall biosynthesis